MTFNDLALGAWFGFDGVPEKDNQWVKMGPIEYQSLTLTPITHFTDNTALPVYPLNRYGWRAKRVVPLA